MATNPSPLQQGAAQGQMQQPRPLMISDEQAEKIRQLLDDLEMQDSIARRYEVREILKRRLFFRGDQYWFWNDDMGVWLPPDQAPMGLNEQYEQPAFQHVTNIIQAHAMGLSAVITQNNTAARFWPEKPSDPIDVETAKNASKAVDYMHRLNDWQNRVDECGYFMCTDGFIGSFVRYISDGERFGNDEMDVLGPVEQEIGPPGVQCADCGYEEEGTTETQPTCPDCGQPLTDVPAPTATTIQKVATIQIPKGREVVTIVPGLQIRRTAYSDNQDEFLYLDWVTDIHKAVAMGTYPDRADQIDSSAGGDTDGQTAATYEKIARRILYLGSGRYTGMTMQDLGTFRRAWIRPKAFYKLTDPDRSFFLQNFPKGIHIVLFNNVCCDVKAEGMDERWETMHTMPGEGQLRETLISSIMPIQEQLNDAINLLFEICMYGVPEGFADTELLNFEARENTGAQAGNITPVKLLPTQNIQQRLQFTPAVEPSVAMMKYIDMLLNQIPQMLDGYFPALFGGDTGQNDTAQGISIQRNQALGRIGRAWRRLQVFLCNTDAKLVKCFAENRTEDAEIPKMSKSGTYESDVLRLEDMKGNVTAYPEVDAQYPTLESDVRSLLLSLWNGANPVFLQTAAVPKNLENIFKYMGTKGIEVPGEDQRKKTYRDIEQMLNEQPQAAPPAPQVPDQPPQPPQQLPSVMPDPDVDDLQVAGDTAKSWLISDAGLDARDANPQGWLNVKLYSKAAAQMAKMKLLQQAIAAQGLAGQGPAADLGGAEALGQPPGPPQKPPANAGPSGSPTDQQASGPEGA